MKVCAGVLSFTRNEYIVPFVFCPPAKILNTTLLGSQSTGVPAVPTEALGLAPIKTLKIFDLEHPFSNVTVYVIVNNPLGYE